MFACKVLKSGPTSSVCILRVLRYKILSSFNTIHVTLDLSVESAPACIDTWRTLPRKQLATTGNKKNALFYAFSPAAVSTKIQVSALYTHVSYFRWVGTTSLMPPQRKNPRWVLQCRCQSTGMARYAGLPRGEGQGWIQASSSTWYLSPSMWASSSSPSWIQRLPPPKLKKRLSDWWKGKRTGCVNAPTSTKCCRNLQEFGSIFMLLLVVVNTEDLDPGNERRRVGFGWAQRNEYWILGLMIWSSCAPNPMINLAPLTPNQTLWISSVRFQTISHAILNLISTY